jgi:membrane-associated phospholipid phosphatase
MTPPPPPFWHWPRPGHLGYALLLGGTVGLWFALVYGGADALTARHGYRVRLHFDAELAVPFVPEAVLGYMSIYLLFWMAPFVLRTRQELSALATTLAAVIAVAGVCFLLFPADMAFPPAGDLGIWTAPVAFAKRLALTYNLAPSLHVTLCTVCVAVYARQTRPAGKLLLWLWAVAVGVSTVLLHQHYVVDVVTGYALALAGVRWCYDRRAGTVHLPEEALATDEHR